MTPINNTQAWTPAEIIGDTLGSAILGENIREGRGGDPVGQTHNAQHPEVRLLLSPYLTLPDGKSHIVELNSVGLYNSSSLTCSLWN